MTKTEPSTPSDIAQIRNICPYGALDTPLLQHVDVVELGEVIDAPADHALVLLAQFENWAPVDAAAIALSAQCVAEQQQRHREVTGEPAPSDLKAEWVEYATTRDVPDVDAASKTKAQLVAENGTQLDDPAEVAAQLAELGRVIADQSPPADVDPPGSEPGSNPLGGGDPPPADPAGADENGAK